MTASFSTPPSARMTSPPARDTAMDNVVPYAGQGTVHRPPSASEDLAPTGLENPKTDHGGPLRSVGKPVFAVALGLALMVVAFANLDHLPALAQDFGTVWVYLVFFLYMSIGGRVFCWGADTLIAEFRKKSNTSGGRR